MRRKTGWAANTASGKSSLCLCMSLWTYIYFLWSQCDWNVHMQSIFVFIYCTFFSGYCTLLKQNVVNNIFAVNQAFINICSIASMYWRLFFNQIKVNMQILMTQTKLAFVLLLYNFIVLFYHGLIIKTANKSGIPI